MNVPTMTHTIIRLIGALQDAAEVARLADPVKYATIKAYQETLIMRLTSKGKSRE